METRCRTSVRQILVCVREHKMNFGMFLEERDPRVGTLSLKTDGAASKLQPYTLEQPVVARAWMVLAFTNVRVRALMSFRSVEKQLPLEIVSPIKPNLNASENLGLAPNGRLTAMSSKNNQDFLSLEVVETAMERVNSLDLFFHLFVPSYLCS